MLVEIEKNKWLNMDYVVTLMCIEDNGTWHVQAHMIDNTHHVLVTGVQKDMEKEYKRIIRDANKRIKEIKYRD